MCALESCQDALMSAEIVQLSDGFSIAFHDFGDPAGRPVVALHDVPTGGTLFRSRDRQVKERGLRLVAPNRPGIGASTQIQSCRVVDEARRICELVGVLGLGEWSVFGISGGGPYATACAAIAD